VVDILFYIFAAVAIGGAEVDVMLRQQPAGFVPYQ